MGTCVSTASVILAARFSDVIGRQPSFCFPKPREKEARGRGRERFLTVIDVIKSRINLSMAFRFDVRSSSNFPGFQGSADRLGLRDCCAGVLRSSSTIPGGLALVLMQCGRFSA